MLRNIGPSALHGGLEHFDNRAVERLCNRHFTHSLGMEICAFHQWEGQAKTAAKSLSLNLLSPARVGAVQFVVPPPDFLGPPRLDEGQNSDDVGVAQDSFERGHLVL
jgi:hypothetical protein